jgi:hypothetical protein
MIYAISVDFGSGWEKVLETNVAAEAMGAIVAMRQDSKGEKVKVARKVNPLNPQNRRVFRIMCN